MLVPPENPEALAVGILKGLDQHWDRNALARRGGEFSVDRSLSEYLDVLHYEAPSPALAGELSTTR